MSYEPHDEREPLWNEYWRTRVPGLSPGYARDDSPTPPRVYHHGSASRTAASMTDRGAAALAVKMAEQGFAVPARNRDEQWDPPYKAAAAILGNDGLYLADGRGVERLRAALDELAERILDRPFADPDDNAAQGARSAKRLLATEAGL